jgi:hypothetical protein
MDERNPDYRKYVPFEPYAEVVRTYFELFQQYEGCVNRTWRHIQEHGPFFPEYDPAMIPDGFRYRPYFRSRSKMTGKLCPSKSGLTSYLTNVVYIGHWTHQQRIVAWEHHEPLIDHDLFMFAFNALSKTDFHGEPNPDYAPYWKAKRHPKSERDKPYPIYADLLFSDDLADRPHQRLATVWNVERGQYQYNLYIPSDTGCVWNIQACYVDLAIDEVLLARLQTITLDETEWQSALMSTQSGSLEDIRQIERQIQHEQQTQDNIIASLRTLTNEEMIHRAQANYEAAARRIETLQADLDSLRTTQQHNKEHILARDALQQIIGQWEQVPREERRRIFEDLASFASLTRISRYEKQLVIYWKDGTTSPSNAVTRHTTRTTTPNYRHERYWSQADIDRLCQMMDNHVHQVEILRTFPGRKFYTLLDCYARHGTSDGKYTRYQGERPYGVNTCWEDTEEYRQEQQE